MVPINGVVVSIGATHPWNIAGVGLDARVAAEFAIRHAVVVTGVTAQDERGLHEAFAVPPAVVEAQLRALPGDVRAIRVGALLDAASVESVAQFLREHPGVPAVVDPVFEASLGGAFADAAAYDALRDHIFSQPVILTPNVPEAQRITGRVIQNHEGALAAARTILALGPGAVLLKGGHLAGDPCDILITGSELHVFEEPRLEGSMRGSGCVLAAALGCALAAGKPLPAAVQEARHYVRQKIAAHRMFGALQVAF